MKRNTFKKLITLLAIILITLYGGFIEQNGTNFSDIINFNDGLFYSCHIDVGQGDCSVIKLPDNRIIMIDSGTEDSYNETEAFLIKNEIEKIREQVQNIE